MDIKSCDDVSNTERKCTIILTDDVFLHVTVNPDGWYAQTHYNRVKYEISGDKHSHVLFKFMRNDFKEMTDVFHLSKKEGLTSLEVGEAGLIIAYAHPHWCEDKHRFTMFNPKKLTIQLDEKLEMFVEYPKPDKWKASINDGTTIYQATGNRLVFGKLSVDKVSDMIELSKFFKLFDISYDKKDNTLTLKMVKMTSLFGRLEIVLHAVPTYVGDEVAELKSRIAELEVENARFKKMHDKLNECIEYHT